MHNPNQVHDFWASLSLIVASNFTKLSQALEDSLSQQEELSAYIEKKKKKKKLVSKL